MYIKLIGILISLLYLAVTAVYFRVFMKEDSRLRKPARVLSATTVLIHVVYLVFLAFTIQRHPITTIFEASTTMAAMLALTFLFIGLLSESRSVGMFVFLFVFVLQTVAALFMDYKPAEYQMMSGWILPAHIYIALAGYAAFATAFLHNIMYLLLERELKASHFGKLFRRFPSLEELDQTSFNAVIFGMVLLFISIVLGFSWYYINFNALPLNDAKVMFTLFAWVIYLIVIVFRYIFGWAGGRIAMLSMCGFIFIMASFTIVNTLMRSFHAHF